MCKFLSSRQRFGFALGGWMLTLALSGCGEALPAMSPVKGMVLYQNKPLKFGSVMFQPESGQPAIGQIKPDGSFELQTYAPGDGAAIGKHRVTITCYESPPPAPAGTEEEIPPGRSLIPAKYNSIETSELTAEVKSTNEPFQFSLK